ncbi:MAG: transcription elongation factor GreA [Candidatus Parcubacteria bacterium]|nr:transcription elongation factor GreA [Patescibacteria group bacterium]BCX16155.1 MAG: transcription elongation factor GreA [Candidatus Parcubacteria bacterium]
MTQYLSKEKVEELKKRLQELKTTKRFEIADKLKRAKEHGDLSENFEYAQAKDEQEKLEKEIFDLENLIKNAQIITKPKNKNVVSVGSTVSLKQDGKLVSYTIVGSQESDPLNYKISNVSPIGKALLGKKVGDKVKVKTPKGLEIELEILKIE